MECQNLDIVDFERAKFFSNLRCIFCWQADFRMLIYTGCRSKRADRERLFIRKVVPYRPQPEGVCFAKQSLFQASNTETKSNRTLTIKDRIIHRPWRFLKRSSSKEEQKAGIPAEKIQKVLEKFKTAKNLITVIKEKQAKRVLTWTELKLFERTDNNAFHSWKALPYYESSILAQDERWRRA